jgi:hypothetical protein
MDRLNPDDIHDAAYGVEEDPDFRGAAARALGYWLDDDEEHE